MLTFSWAYSSDNSPLTIPTHWHPSIPNGGTAQNCAGITALNNIALWEDYHCTSSLPFICEAPKFASYLSKCPQGFELFWKRCYKYHPQKMTQAEAVAFCPTLYSGAKLHEPKSPFHVLAAMRDKDDLTGRYHNRWVGINDRNAEGTFVFESDASDITGNEFFVSGFPAGASAEDDCVWLPAGSDRYEDVPCDNLASFYCEVSLSTENYVTPFVVAGAIWNKWVEVEFSTTDATLCAQLCSDRSPKCYVFAFIEPDRCFLGDESPWWPDTAISEPANALVYVRRAIPLDTKMLYDYMRLTKVNGTEWTRWMQHSFAASTFEECALVCHSDDTQDCDAFAFVNEDGMCYVGDLRVRNTFGVFEQRPIIAVTVYTKHGEINTENDRSIYWDNRLYEDWGRGTISGVHKNRDSCEFFNDGHSTMADTFTTNIWIIGTNVLTYPGLILDLHNQVEILKVLLIRATTCRHNNRSLKDFLIDVSSDLYEWRPVAKSQLTHINFQWACSTTYQPIVEIVLSELTVGRYLLLTPLTSWHGGGEPVALKYFGVETSNYYTYIPITCIYLFTYIVDTATTYPDPMVDLENVPASIWTTWIYASQAGSTLEDCITACRADTGNNCAVTLLEGMYQSQPLIRT